ncbi:MAG: DUF1002 domain-containing protein [Lachnospiraceae bacterium]|nr:DUF1002 domain-containing protein [Lachnospiraceae bacterium]
MKKIVCLGLIALLLSAQSFTVFAAEEEILATERPIEEAETSEASEAETSEAESTEETAEEESSVEKKEESEDVSGDETGTTGAVEIDPRPYLALGADLTPEQLATVLDAMGILGEDLSNYNVVHITNQMEHEYLDGYIESSVIGTRSLSSVMVKQKPAGSGLMVTTKNITYCTINMYRNALITSGVQDAEIIIVGPSPISGTAALIGAMKAYENMAGETLSEEAQDTAMEELVVLGRLRESFGEATEVEEFMEYVKAEIVAAGIDDPEKIREIVEKAAEEYDITLTEEQLEMIVSLMEKIGKLDIDPKKLLEQAGDLYEKYGETILKDAKAKLDEVLTDEVKASIWTAIGNFFKGLWDTILGWFTK